MKIALLNLYLLFFSFTILGNGPNQIISCHVNNISFADFSDLIYKKSNVRIFYDDLWVNKLVVTLNEDEITVIDAVKLAISGTNLKVSIWNNHIILLPDEELLDQLPDFTSNDISDQVLSDAGDSLTESEGRYMKGRKTDIIYTIQIGNKDSVNVNTNLNIKGKITDKETGDFLVGATMFIEETSIGVLSNSNGFFSITLTPGKYSTTFECLGFEKKKCLLEVFSNGNFKIEMNKRVLSIKEILVHGDRQMNILSSDPGLVKIQVKTIKEIPTLMGERDILKVSEMLPGIVSVGEGSSGLNVRGGNADQNAFYINKIPIFNTSHLFGFFPAFNSDIIKDFSIFKGYVPSQFGGRLSSVFNIITRQGNKKRFSTHGGINPITGSLTIEGPVKKDVCSVLFSVRSSYSDWLLSRIKDPVIRTSSAKFSDYSASINYDFEKTQISAFTYLSNDFFRLSDITTYKYSNAGTSINIHHSFSPSLRSNFSLIGSQYTFETTNQQQISSAYQHKYKIEHYELRNEFEHLLNEKNTLNYGVSVILYKLNRGEIVPFGEESYKDLVNLGNERGVEGALYFSDQYNILPKIDLTVGVRYVMFSPMGPKTAYTYPKDVPIDNKYVEDSIFFDSNKPIKFYSAPEIRAVANIKTDTRGSIKLAFNQMHQNLYMLNNTITVAPNTQWKLADYHLRPSSSNQFSAGVFRNFLKPGLETSIEFFYKSMDNYTEFKDGADFLTTPNIETVVLQGKQRAYGLEFFLKRSNRKLDGWLSYTFSRSFVKVDDNNAWNRINNGEEYPSNFDIPHSFNSVINYHITRRISVSNVVTYQTGRPVTYPVAVYYVNDIQYTDYSKRNAYRIPDYFRIDLSLKYEGNLKRNKLIHSSWMFSVYNLTGRKNPYSVYFENKNGKINSYKYSIIGVPLFTITWLFKLGNYASD